MAEVVTAVRRSGSGAGEHRMKWVPELVDASYARTSANPAAGRRPTRIFRAHTCSMVTIVGFLRKPRLLGQVNVLTLATEPQKRGSANPSSVSEEKELILWTR